MKIVYAVTTCSDRVYARLFADKEVKPAFQSQKYHRLLIEGLAASCPVDVVASPPVNRSVLDQPIVRLEDEVEGNARYHYISAVRNPIRKLLHMAFGTFGRTLRYAHGDSAVVVDCLNCTVSLAALLAAKIRGVPCVGIVTDLPDLLGMPGPLAKLSLKIIDHCSHYVFLTEAMNRRLNPLGKPYVILEGHCDASMAQQEPSMQKKAPQRIVFYAGGVSVQYGLADLVAGFQKADLPNTRLEIYGPGDYVEQLKKVAEKDPRIVYGGMLLNREIVAREQEATLLVNPRPTGPEYVKYSFPSKTMEYMASGTPVLTTVLPGMPGAYYPYVSFIRDESPDGIARALRDVLTHGDEELFAMGAAARSFVLKERSNLVQAKKILTMLEL